MEVSANWVFILIIIPISGILVGAWDLTKKKIYIWLLVMLWGVVGIYFCLVDVVLHLKKNW
jgi:hypothetical protein